MSTLPTTAPPAPECARVVAAARALYLHQGIAAVSMAAVALYLRLPEVVVASCFADKTGLVAAVVEAHAAAVQAEAHHRLTPCSTPVEELLALRNWASEELRQDVGPFFEELAADYPASRQRWQQHMADFPVTVLRDNLRRGIAQGFYQPHLDVEAAVQQWFAQRQGLAHVAREHSAELHRTQFNAFLASLVTPAGALVARRLQEAAPYY